MAITRIVMPERATKGDIIDIRAIVQHIMETGYRRDNNGVPITRDIIKTFVVTYAGDNIFAVDLTQGIAANPFFAFSTVASETGDIEFAWTDEHGQTIASVKRRLTVA